ncbi:MAG: hypothetical protein GF364_09045 [Candidatus Lokiarchaeota archaeon]|nr:hypothetical protein [Candidatus Lokiarchaeota archaeon]
MRKRTQIIKEFPANYLYLYNIISFLKDNIDFELGIEKDIAENVPEYANAGEETKQLIKHVLAKTYPAKITLKSDVVIEDLEINLLEAIRLLKNMKKLVMLSDRSYDVKHEWKERIGKIAGFFEIFFRRMDQRSLNFENYDTLLRQLKLLKIHLANVFDFFVELDEYIYEKVMEDYRCLTADMKKKFNKEIGVRSQLENLDEQVRMELTDLIQTTENYDFIFNIVDDLNESQKIKLYQELEKQVTFQTETKFIQSSSSKKKKSKTKTRSISKQKASKSK